MTFNVITLGCKVNQYESQAMTEKMLAEGFVLSPSKEIADIFIVNTCTVTSVSDSKNRKLIRRIRRSNPDAVIAVTGCMTQAFPDDEVYDICDIVIGNTQRNEIASLIKAFLLDRSKYTAINEHKSGEVFEPLTITDFEERTRAQIKIEDGCNRFCAYCIIPYARGRVRSKDIGELFAEAKQLSRRGYKEIVLVGINLSCFGQDTGTDLCEAVEAVARVDGVERIRLGSLEPERLDPEFIGRLAKCKKLCPQFHLSLQSGCDATLKRMNRHYTSAEYRAIVDDLRKAFPDCAITTDVMVGFAGETDEEFMQSLSFVHSISFAKVHVFSYSRRRGTAGDSLPNQVDQSVKNERSKQMIAVTDSDRKIYLNNQVGKTASVLFERRRTDGYWEGYAPDYTPIRVYSEKELSDIIAEVKLISAYDDHCVGELL